jgi:DNA-3-methyladenine glycosylase I
MQRCEWAKSDLAIRYHDTEWGVPQHDDRVLFEFLILEGAQAGLSWETILKKRSAYRSAFDRFDPSKVSRYTARKIDTLLRNHGIVRNRLKIAAAIQNARVYLKVQKEFVSFDAYLWKFVGGRPIQNQQSSLKRIPATTSISDWLSKDLRNRGFKFVGSTICYALMQAVGMVNDHSTDCFRYREVRRLWR